MSNEHKSANKGQYGNRGRSLSRQILGNDLDVVNKYSHYSKPVATNSSGLRRTNTYTSVPNPYGSRSPYGSYGNAYGHGYGSGSGSSTSSNGYSNNSRRPRRQPSNLINTSTLKQWDTNSMNSQESDMSAAMSAMVNSYQTRVTNDAQFLDEIQAEAAENEEFGKVENVEQWSVKEVCHWLNGIHLDKYIKAFKDQIIDGSILIRDLDEGMLVNELGIKRLHVKKLLREIAKLAKNSPKVKKESNDARDELIQSLRSEIVELKRKNKSLMDTIQRNKK